MLNILWPIFIIISFFYAIISGNVENLNNSIFSSTQSAIDLSITLLGTMCLWNGIINIANKTCLIEKFTKVLQPLINIIFPNIKKNSQINKEISMNIVANMLGLGNAATPMGIKAMKTMQKENTKKDTLTDNMMLFIVLNTASLQIIPTTVIAIRSSYRF